MHCVTTMRWSSSQGPSGDIWRMSEISTPKLSQEAGYVTPNVNTVYGFGFMDLGPEPIILTVPNSHGRYYMVESSTPISTPSPR